MMWKIYLLGLLGNLSAFFAIMAVILGIALFFGWGTYYGDKWYKDDSEKKFYRWLMRGTIAFFICIMGCMFIPTTKQLYAIVGIGGTLEYLQNNDKAKQLPDKVIDAVYKYFDDSKEEK